MSNQDPNLYDKNQYLKSNTDPNDTHESTSKTDRPISVGENEENHTSGDQYKYQKEGISSQEQSAGQDGKNIHTDNQGGTSVDD